MVNSIIDRGPSKAVALDFRGRATKDFHPSRDFGAITCPAWWSTDKLVGANGSSVQKLLDRSGYGNDAANGLLAARPILHNAALNGKPVITFAADQFLKTPGDTFRQPARPQPLTYVALIKITGSLANYQYVISSVTSITGLVVNTTALDAGLLGYGGTLGSSVNGGPNICDGNWHVVIVSFGPNGQATFVDGMLVATRATQGGTNAAVGPIQIGHSVFDFVGEFAEGGLLVGDLPYGAITGITQALSDKWNLGIAVPNLEGADVRDLTDSAGQAVRVWVPRNWNGAVVIANHSHGSDQLTIAGDDWYASLYSICAAGYAIGEPNNHGISNWNAITASTDGTNALALVETTMNAPASRVCLLGWSMGAMLSVTQAKENRFGSKLKGLALVDGPFDEHWVYTATTYIGTMNVALGITQGTLSSAMATIGLTSAPTTSTFAKDDKLMVGIGTANEEVVTATAASTGASVAITATINAHASGEKISNYPTKSAGRDPMLWLAGDVPAGLRWRFYATSADTTVNKIINTDAMTAKVAALWSPAENVVRVHGIGHLSPTSFDPPDLVAHFNRCM